MSKWTFWEWIAYAGLFVAAVIIAADQGIKMEPDLLQKTGGLIFNPIWAFAPVVLVVLATFILVGREFDWIGKHKNSPQLSAPVVREASVSNPMTSPSQATIKSPPQKVAAPEQENGQEKINWEFVGGIDPDHLWSFFKNHMTVEADRLVEPYLGQTTTIRGLVRDISYDKERKSASVRLVGKDTFDDIARSLHFIFDGEQAARISIVTRHSVVEITGMITYVSAHDCEFKKCSFTIVR